MPVAKKERPNHKCWWQTKNGKQTADTKWKTNKKHNNKNTPETTSKTQTVAYLQI